MPAEYRKPSAPTPTIGLSKGQKRPMRNEDIPTKVIDPKTGKTHTMTRSNARDKVRLDGWIMGVENKAPEPEAAPDKEVEVEKAEDDIGENDTMENKREPNELDILRDQYKEKTGKDADKRWGKAVIQTKIELADNPPGEASDED